LGYELAAESWGVIVLKKMFISAVAVSSAAAALLTVSTIFAHSRPVRFDPPPGAVLTAAPSKVEGWFTAELRRDPDWNFLRVSDAQGNRVDAGESTLSTNRRQMSVVLRPGLAAGRYLVTWRTWDDNDGRIFGDCYTFFVGQAAADAATNDKFRLDGGGTCQRIDISGTQGTPVAGGTPPAAATAATPGDGHGEGDGTEPADDEDSDGVPIWGLIAGIIAGVVAGGVGGRLLSSRA